MDKRLAGTLLMIPFTALLVWAEPTKTDAFQIPLPAPESTLRVFSGKSVLVNSPDPLTRVSVTDPEIASAIITGPRQVLIHGQAPGSVTLLLWDDQDRTRSFNLAVELDMRGLRATLQQLFDREDIEVSQLGSSLVLSGSVSSEEVEEKALQLVKTQSAEVVNLLRRSEERRAVLLQVRFAEVDRIAVQELGVNLFSTGAGNTVGSATTQQFENPVANVGSIPAGVEGGRLIQTPIVMSGGIGNPLHRTPSVFGLTDLLNLFIFRSDVNLGATIRSLQQRNLLQILAEPNVLALNGKEASFLAGGEFPFPVLQGGSTFQGVTIVFKEFGVRLKFTPQIQRDGSILLKVSPEVSSLDFANALTVSGFLIPALSTRRAETEVSLREGQSFAIAGLIDNRTAEIVSKVPLLGDIPLVGKLFRSRASNRNQTELMVVVTPKLVRPTDHQESVAIPSMPAPMLDRKQFDSKVGSSPKTTESGNEQK